MSTIENEEGWQLQALEIRYQSYGEFAGKHTAKIIFQNKGSDAFTFNLTPEKTQAYLFLLKDEIVNSAGMLGQRLLQSLNLLPAPPEVKSIGEVISHEPV